MTKVCSYEFLKKIGNACACFLTNPTFKILTEIPFWVNYNFFKTESFYKNEAICQKRLKVWKKLFWTVINLINETVC